MCVCAGRGRRLTDHGLRAAALASQQSLLLRYCGLEVLAYARFRVYYTYIITKRERRAVESKDSAKERGRDEMLMQSRGGQRPRLESAKDLPRRETDPKDPT